MPLSARLASLLATGLGAAVLAWALMGGEASQRNQAAALARNPQLDPGTALQPRPAPTFSLRDQFGRRTSLAEFRGRVVLLAFTDPECRGICPLTTAEMLHAKQLLGSAGAPVQLLGIDANPAAETAADLRTYSHAHGLMSSWRFLTGPPAQLRAIWRAYGIEARLTHGQSEHTPALYLIDQAGRLRRLYVTQQTYSGAAQQAQVIAEAISALLPGRPRVRSHLPYTPIDALGAGASVPLPLLGGGKITLGASGGAHLLLFFATWDGRLEDLRGHLLALGGYAHAAGALALPAPVAIDVAPVEPSPGSLASFIKRLPRRLPYPLAVDSTGRVADGYGVEEEPWLALSSATGKLLWFRDVATSGWPSNAELLRELRAALAQPSQSGRGSLTEPHGSPPALARLQADGGQLLAGGQAALQRRIAQLRGFPVVLDAWASWCTACQQEQPLLARAALRFGTQVAFLGADSEDQPGAARSFLSARRPSYPSYAVSGGQLGDLAPLEGLPETLYLDRAGRLRSVHFGPYDSQGSLDGDIESYALAAG